MNRSTQMEDSRPEVSFLNQSLRFISSFSLKCAVDLDISDHIHAYGRPMPLSELARSISVPPEKEPMLGRLMQLLVQQGVFANSGDGYQLTPFSEFLMTSDSRSRAFVRFNMEIDLIKDWVLMSEWLKSRDSSTLFEMGHHGQSFWNFTMERPEIGNLFNELTSSRSKKEAKELVASGARIFDGLKSLVDVGGGIGTTAQIITETFPSLKCTVLDLPHVVSKAPSTNGKFDIIGGDMFENIPHADAVLLKNVLHNWDDYDAVRILKRCKEAISSSSVEPDQPCHGGKIIILDIVINSETDAPEVVETCLLFDMLMMTNLGGRERNENDWKKIFLDAGFCHYEKYPTSNVGTIIELRP